jgi:hypothetical protein
LPMLRGRPGFGYGAGEAEPEIIVSLNGVWWCQKDKRLSWFMLIQHVEYCWMVPSAEFCAPPSNLIYPRQINCLLDRFWCEFPWNCVRCWEHVQEYRTPILGIWRTMVFSIWFMSSFKPVRARCSSSILRLSLLGGLKTCFKLYIYI